MSEIATYLDIIRFLTGFIILFYASYTDIKTRRASNILWVIMVLIGLILLTIQFLIIGFTTPFYLIFVPIMIVLMYILFQLRLIFGGADAKALMALAVLVPFQPEILQFPLWKTVMPFPWTIFSNSIILFLLIPLSLFISNLIKRHIEFPYSFLGYKMDVKKAKQKFVWPLEQIVDGKRKFLYMPKDFDVTEQLNEFEQQGIKTIWVTPKIPFMIPLLAGFVVSFYIGDILFYLMGLFT